MILRGSSTAILNSFLPHSRDSSSEPEIVHQIPRAGSITLSASSSSFSTFDDSPKKMTRALSEADHRDLSVPLPEKKPFNPLFNMFSNENEQESVREKRLSAHSSKASLGRGLFSFSELDEEFEVSSEKDCSVSVLVGGGIGGVGGRIDHGGESGGSDNGGDGNSGSWDSNHGKDSMDMYYQQMIEANPGNPLLLGNYAKYLKEVRGLLCASAIFWLLILLFGYREM